MATRRALEGFPDVLDDNQDSGSLMVALDSRVLPPTLFHKVPSLLRSSSTLLSPP